MMECALTTLEICMLKEYNHPLVNIFKIYISQIEPMDSGLCSGDRIYNFLNVSR